MLLSFSVWIRKFLECCTATLHEAQFFEDKNNWHRFSSVQSLSCVQLFAAPWTAARQASLSIANSCSLPKLMSIESVMPSNHLILCLPLLLLPSIFPSWPQSSPASGSFPMSQLFASGGKSIGISASTSVLPMIVRTDFLSDWLVWFPCSPGDSQESSPTPQFKSINSLALSLLYGPLSHPYMTTEETIALTRWTFAGKVMSLFNML